MIMICSCWYEAIWRCLKNDSSFEVVGGPHFSSEEVCNMICYHVLFTSITAPYCHFMFSVRSLVRILKDMQKHVPGLQLVESWYIQLLVNLMPIFFVMMFHTHRMSVSATVQWFHWLVMSHSRWWMASRGYGSCCRLDYSCLAQLVYLTPVR